MRGEGVNKHQNMHRAGGEEWSGRRTLPQQQSRALTGIPRTRLQKTRRSSRDEGLHSLRAVIVGLIVIVEIDPGSWFQDLFQTQELRFREEELQGILVDTILPNAARTLLRATDEHGESLVKEVVEVFDLLAVDAGRALDQECGWKPGGQSIDHATNGSVQTGQMIRTSNKPSEEYHSSIIHPKDGDKSLG